MSTTARTFTADSAHWYYTDGRPCYELPKKDGSGMKVPTLADARKLNLCPSVTTILRVLNKPALNEWITEQAVLAVLTTPRLPGEADDAFVYRVLHTEKVQDQESRKARDLGTDIHSALEATFMGTGTVDPALLPWIEAPVKALLEYGKTFGCETILVGDGYAGKTDLIQDAPDCWRIWDFKTSKKLPAKSAWSEHVLQLAAYAKAWHEADANYDKSKPIKLANCYISTTEPGQFKIFEHDPNWDSNYGNGFLPLLIHWQWANSYHPLQ